MRSGFKSKQIKSFEDRVSYFQFDITSPITSSILLKSCPVIPSGGVVIFKKNDKKTAYESKHLVIDEWLSWAKKKFNPFSNRNNLNDISVYTKLNNIPCGAKRKKMRAKRKASERKNHDGRDDNDDETSCAAAEIFIFYSWANFIISFFF